MENNGVISIQDNFLAEEEFVALRNIIINQNFPWYFTPKPRKELFRDDFDSEFDPGTFNHIVYEDNTPTSPLYESHFLSILAQLDCAILTRIRITFASLIFPKPFRAERHQDIVDLKEAIAAKWTSSILYMNTNNGYTEFETGKKVESVENRLVTFPSEIHHCGISQTDEQTRILINFGYLRNAK